LLLQLLEELLRALDILRVSKHGDKHVECARVGSHPSSEHGRAHDTKLIELPRAGERARSASKAAESGGVPAVTAEGKRIPEEGLDRGPRGKGRRGGGCEEPKKRHSGQTGLRRRGCGWGRLGLVVPLAGG
jgi:hypothetical protein